MHCLLVEYSKNYIGEYHSSGLLQKFRNFPKSTTPYYFNPTLIHSATPQSEGTLQTVPDSTSCFDKYIIPHSPFPAGTSHEHQKNSLPL